MADDMVDCPLCTCTADGRHDPACAARTARPRPGAAAARNGGPPRPRTAAHDADALSAAYRDALTRARAFATM